MAFFFSSVMRLGSACKRVMNEHVYRVDIVSVVFRSAFAHDTQAPTQALWCGAISYNSRSHLMLQQDKVNCARYISQVVNPVLL